LFTFWLPVSPGDSIRQPDVGRRIPLAGSDWLIYQRFARSLRARPHLAQRLHLLCDVIH
jgi:hypothetical protein